MGKAKTEAKAVMAEEDEDAEEQDGNAGEPDYDGDVERDAAGKLTGVRIDNGFVEADKKKFFLRRHSLVLVQADEGEHKFLGYIRELVQMARDVKANICWFYRAADLAGAAPTDMVICRARLAGRAAGGDKGSFKELFFSNHADKISVQSIMHPIKVWLLPSESLDPVTVPPEAGPVAAAAAATKGRGPLLPGFVCRRMYDIHTREVFPLSEVPSRRQQLPDWIVEDVAELLRRSEQEREDFKREWVHRCQLRAARAQQGQAGGAEAAAAGMDVG